MIIDKQKTVCGLNIWDKPFEAVKELKPLCRKMAAEGSVLLKNDGALPFKEGEKIALFGRIQEGYIKSGTGSGGNVRIEKKPCIWDSFEENGVFKIDNELVEIYKKWIKDNPFDNGHGWATEPWVQVEMPVSEELAEHFAAKNDAAVIVINRTAGEDKDNADAEGSYRLTPEEESLLKNVTSKFSKTVVVLNVGNIIDVSFMDKYPVSAVMYAWQGGAEGANALADMLSGKISPCGKLPNTQLKSIEGLPFLSDFGDKNIIKYTEDIYVGYRYTETFDKDRVKFPFGYGLTYTDFDIKYSAVDKGDSIIVKAEVTNVGSFPSREVVQVYFGAPCGKLGAPEKQLLDFKKTEELQPNESEVLEITFEKARLSAYDDSGATGNKHCYVMEKGEYKIFVGTDVRSSRDVLSFVLDETVVTEQLEEVMAPETAFDRIVAKEENGKRVISLEAAPLRETDLDKRILTRRGKEIPYTGDKGIKLLDVYEGKNSIEEFVAQITDQDLTCLVCGEGMNSPKVTPGTGGAFGGVTDKLLEYGIPVCCVTDGPSGLRLADQYMATAMPNGYVFAASFDEPLIEEIFALEGVEMFRYNIDALLGPGMNIHRHPLCGRNFEYFSEDPVLSGKVAAAQSRGLKKTGCTTTIKHFCGNNQELGRHTEDSVISVRALREIYLKGFEIAVKEGGATAIMTSYNLVNGYHSASNYDLTTTVLRKEWGYTGMVMTDWWARCNVKGDSGNTGNLKAMVRAQNDIYMVCPSSENKPHNIIEGLNEGYIVRSDLQRTAINLLRYIMDSPTFMKFVDGGCVIPEFAKLDETDMKLLATVENPVAEGDYEVEFGGDRDNIFVIELASHSSDLAQSGFRIYVDSAPGIALAIEGTKGKFVIHKRQLKKPLGTHKLTFKFEHMVEVKSVKIYG